MSDIVVGGLIGIGGAIVGAIVVAFSSYIIARLQINARRDELSQQQKYNEQQAQIERLIKSRENVLIPLRKVVSNWMEASKQEQQMSVRLKHAYEDKNDTQRQAQEAHLWIEAADKAKQVTSELTVLRGQIGDSILDQSIEVAQKAYWETVPESTNLSWLFNHPQNLDINSISRAIEKRDSILNNLRGYLLTVNKRIEELLNGEPSN